MECYQSALNIEVCCEDRYLNVNMYCIVDLSVAVISSVSVSHKYIFVYAWAF